jgi:hypothetical protein
MPTINLERLEKLDKFLEELEASGGNIKNLFVELKAVRDKAVLDATITAVIK